MHQGAPFMTLTLMGGDMQAQGHAQTLVDVIDLGANVQAASDMARFRHVQIPERADAGIVACTTWWARPLSSMGHEVQSVDGANMGGFQSIMVQPQALHGCGPIRRGCTAVAPIIVRTARWLAGESHASPPDGGLAEPAAMETGH